MISPEIHAQQTAGSEAARTAEKQTLPVRLHGTVLMANAPRTGFTLHDATRGIFIVAPAGAPCPDSGDVVDVEGTSQSQVWGGRSRQVIDASSVQVTGKQGKLPQAKAVSLTDATVMKNLDQWVSVEGQVLEWTHDASLLSIVLLARDALSVVVVRLEDGGQLPPNLNAAVLRITGVNAPYGTATTSLCSPGIAQVEILEPGTKTLFGAPEASVPDILDRKVPLGRLVRAKGVVVGMMASNRPIICSTHAGDGAMIVDLRPTPGSMILGSRAGETAPPTMEIGEVIEVVGAVTDRTDMPGSGLSSCFARHAGTAPVPPPLKVEMHEITPAHSRDQWVSVEGVVTGWSQQADRLWYSVTTVRSKKIFNTRVPNDLAFPDDLHGAVLRFTGLWFGGSHLPRDDFFIVPDIKHVEVVKPGTRDPFAAPERTLEEIASDSSPSGRRVKARGTVVGLTDGPVLHLRGAKVAVTASVQLPWNRPKGGNGGQFADGGPVRAIAPGDEVEIVGSPVRSPVRPEMEECDLIETHVRVIKKAGPAAPQDATLAAVARDAYTSDFVRLRGRLLAFQQLPAAAGRWRTTMMIEAGGVSFPVIHEAAQRTSFGTLREDDELLVSGLVKRATSMQPRHLRLADPADVKSLGLAPAIVQQRLWMGGAAAAIVLLMMGVWIIALNRSVRYRTAELREAQGRLEQALQHERELGEMKSRFVSMVSHEFRTPLGVIMSAADVLRSYFDRLSAEKRERHLDMIFNSTRSLAGLMEEVLLLGRVEEGKLQFSPAPLDLEKFCRLILDEVNSSCGGACSIELHVGGGLENACSDETLLRHIVGNLLSNAVKYSEPGQPVEFSIARDHGDAVITVRDHGIGIPADDQPHIFHSFTRGSNVGTRPGSGLGLVIVQRCVLLHGGAIDLQSSPGKGTTVTVTLPMFVPHHSSEL